MRELDFRYIDVQAQQPSEKNVNAFVQAVRFCLKNEETCTNEALGDYMHKISNQIKKHDAKGYIFTRGSDNKNKATWASWGKNNGLLKNSDTEFAFTPIGEALVNQSLSYSSYNLLLLSQLHAHVKEDNTTTNKTNVLYILCSVLCEEYAPFKYEEFISKVKSKYNIDKFNIEKDTNTTNTYRHAIESSKIISLIIDENEPKYAISDTVRPIINFIVENEQSMTIDDKPGSLNTGILSIFNQSNAQILFEDFHDLWNIIEQNSNNTTGFVPKLGNLQQIFYGAPGTGKSHGIKDKENLFAKVIRTTFHPDSDYSTFVGAYKPTMEDSEIKVTPVVISNGISLDQNNGTYKEKRIAYTFVKQAFLKAYIEAWKRLGNEENVLLVIEEINRGNCAQIFGDLFQLLDRNDKGFSDYPIQADEDLRKVLADEFADLDNIPENVKSGEELLLPNNLYIWATMNTSDQSLFPIDSAFKRRWDWKYMKIKDGKLDWKIDIELNGEKVDWWTFMQKINAIIASMTSSADKQLGYFFCKADRDGLITAETFVSKVIFYLWNDVFKDYGFEDASLFRYNAKEGDKEVEKDLTFPDFYDEDGENVNTERLADFVKRVMNWQKQEANL